MKTVLVVEDTEDLRELFLEVLRRAGYGVIAAENGQAALDVLDAATEAPCAVLLDLMMPVMDGATFMQVLCDRDEATPPVIVVSATIGAGGVPGAAALLTKPVASSVLLEVVRDCCGLP